MGIVHETKRRYFKKNLILSISLYDTPPNPLSLERDKNLSKYYISVT